MSVKTKKVDLTVYKAKDHFDAVAEVLKPEVVCSDFPVNADGNELGTLFLMSSKSTTPRWASLFFAVVTPEQIGRNQSTGGLLIVKEQGHLFLLSFGQGRHLIKTGCIETNFGLRTALNILEPESIRSIDKSSLEAQPKLAREQSGEAVGLQFFGIDIERDLLRAITGTPKDEAFGKRVSGGDPLKISVNLQLSNVRELLSKLLGAYTDDSYKSGPFAWIDHIGEVKDKSVIEQLDDELVGKLSQRDVEFIWLCAPTLIDWDRVCGFKYSGSRKSIRYYDTRIEECLKEIGKNGIDIDLIKRREIHAVDSEDQTVFEDIVYRFIYAEIWHNEETHILNAGKWYAVNAGYVKRIQEQYNAICAKVYKRDLLEYDDETEAAYNKRVAESNSSEYALLDANNISLPDAASPIEPCDLYRNVKELIHVKRYGGSRVLSHLFNQGLVSGELFQRDVLFRNKFNEKLPMNLQIDGIERIPDRKEYTVVYAIISEQKEGLSVPFFSKISLKHAVSRLEAFGFDVRLAKIPVSDLKKKTMLCAPA